MLINGKPFAVVFIVGAGCAPASGTIAAHACSSGANVPHNSAITALSKRT